MDKKTVEELIEVMEKEKNTIEALKKKKNNLENKIKASEDRIRQLDMNIKEIQFESITNCISLKGLTLEDLQKSIEKGDFSIFNDIQNDKE